MTSTAENTVAVIEKIIGGDDGALKALYQDHFGKIKALAAKYSRNEADAEDIFQESLIDMIKNFTSGKFRGESSIGTYLYSICKYKFLNLNRGQKIKTTELNANLNPIDEGRDPAIDEEERVLLEEIKNISPDCQNVLTLFYFYKLPWIDIAKKLEYSDKFVRVKSNRCKNELRKRLLEIPSFKVKYGS